MKFLVAVPKERVSGGRWTTVREPVVPCFPTQGSGLFLTVPSFLMADRAEVAETDADPDEMVERMHHEYPGLPRGLHANYVLEVFKAVSDCTVGTVFRVSVSRDSATLIDDSTRETRVLWTRQPLPRRSDAG